MKSLRILFFISIIFFSITISLKGQLTSLTAVPDRKKVEMDAGNLKIADGFVQNLKWNLPLDTIGENGSIISWMSDKPEFISNTGKLLKQSPRNKKKIKVKMTASVKAGKYSKKKSFDVYIAFEEPKYDGYLFAYFEGRGDGKLQEQLRFGASADAVNWFALNDNKPILSSSDISQTGGIRDPYIMRGEDEKTFYMVATDMFTIQNGWSHNPGIIMLKSENLTDWQHSIIDLAKLYPEKFGNVKWVWAPQAIFDPSENRYMIYFTIRFKDEKNLDFYCAYANDDFTGFTEEPKLMFRAKHGAIDGDIIYNDGIYHFFYKGNTKNENGKEGKNGIQQAIGTSLKGPWTEDFNYVDVYAGKTVVEGSSIFKLNNSDTYILMYDLYTSGRYEFQRSTNLYDFTQTPESFTKNFFPRHGSVMNITREEAIRLNKKWGGVPQELLNQ